jgi:Protein of unknown function (DUF2975)
MKATVFKPLANGLYYLTTFTYYINIVIAAISIIFFLFKSWIPPKYYPTTHWSYIDVPVQFTFKKEADTTIIFVDKKTKSAQFRFYSDKQLSSKSRPEYNPRQIQNQGILDMYKSGMLEIADTIICSITSKKPSPFRFSEPVGVNGYLRAQASNADEHQWIGWYRIISSVIAFLCYFWLVSQFRLLLKNIRNNVFFLENNFQYLRTIAFLLMLSPLISSFTSLPLWLIKSLRNNSYLFHHSGFINKNSENIFSINDYTNHWDVNLSIFDSSFLAGVAILILAEIFRYGIKLQQENELTI